MATNVDTDLCDAQGWSVFKELTDASQSFFARFSFEIALILEVLETIFGLKVELLCSFGHIRLILAILNLLFGIHRFDSVGTFIYDGALS